MDIKELLGDAWKDGMTVEEISAALADKNLVDPTTLPKSVDKSVFDKTASELSKLKKELNEMKDASLTADEKVQKAVSDAETARVDFLKKSTRLDVEKIFVDGGLVETDYKDIIDGLVTEDSVVSVATAQKLMSVITAQKTAIEKSVKAQLLKDTPKPPAGGGGKALTANDILNIQDTVDRQNAIAENIELFKED